MFPRKLVATLLKDKRHYLKKGATLSAIGTWERRWNLKIPSELKEALRAFNGGELFQTSVAGIFDARFRFCSIEEIVPLRSPLLPGIEASSEVGELMRVVDLADSDRVALECRSAAPDCGAVYEIFHELFPKESSRTKIAASLHEFLQRILRADGNYYWLKDQ
jgi:hypothetical protein